MTTLAPEYEFRHCAKCGAETEHSRQRGQIVSGLAVAPYPWRCCNAPHVDVSLGERASNNAGGSYAPAGESPAVKGRAARKVTAGRSSRDEPIGYVPTEKAQERGLRMTLVMDELDHGRVERRTVRFAQSHGRGDLVIRSEPRLVDGREALCLVGAEIDGGAS